MTGGKAHGSSFLYLATSITRLLRAPMQFAHRPSWVSIGIISVFPNLKSEFYQVLSRFDPVRRFSGLRLLSGFPQRSRFRSDNSSHKETAQIKIRNFRSGTRVNSARPTRFFYLCMAVLAAAVVFVGFSRTYYLKGIFGRPSLSLLTHMHGALFTSWILLFITQALLVVRKRTGLHRQLGAAGGVLAALMIPVGMAMAITSARHHAFESPGSAGPLVALTIPFFDIVVFAVIVAAGFYYRRTPQTHKRLMLLATIALLPAAFARFPLHFIDTYGPLAFFGITDLIVIACTAYDTLIFRRLHPAYLWGGLLLIASHPVRLFVGHTGVWIAFAHWLTGA